MWIIMQLCTQNTIWKGHATNYVRVYDKVKRCRARDTADLYGDILVYGSLLAITLEHQELNRGWKIFKCFGIINTDGSRDQLLYST